MNRIHNNIDKNISYNIEKILTTLTYFNILFMIFGHYS